MSNPTTYSRLASELSFNRGSADHEPVTDSSLTYGDLRRFKALLNVMADAERAVGEYSCRTSVSHIASEMSALASRIRECREDNGAFGRPQFLPTEDGEFNGNVELVNAHDEAFPALREAYTALGLAFWRIESSSRTSDGELCRTFGKVRGNIEAVFRNAGERL